MRNIYAGLSPAAANGLRLEGPSPLITTVAAGVGSSNAITFTSTTCREERNPFSSFFIWREERDESFPARLKRWRCAFSNPYRPSVPLLDVTAAIACCASTPIAARRRHIYEPIKHPDAWRDPRLRRRESRRISGLAQADRLLGLYVHAPRQDKAATETAR
ncbi:hypothetical protein MRX96_051650 [Rhipicephalus microplus]